MDATPDDFPLEYTVWLRLRPFFAGHLSYAFPDFVKEVGPLPSIFHTVSRKSASLPLQPGNVRWVAGGLPQAEVESPYFDYKRAASYCRCAVKTLQNAKANGMIQAVAGGAGVKFEQRELDRWMRARKSSGGKR